MIEDYNASGELQNIEHGYENPNPTRAKAIEEDGDFDMNLNYDGETVARVMDSDTYTSESDFILNGKAPWLTGGDTDEFDVPTESGVQYALVNEASSLMLYDEDGNVERLGDGTENEGVVAHFWEEDDADHFEERGTLKLVPGIDTEVSTREKLA